ncbi:MAG: S8 family serine peptidase [Polyangia bacterium]
MSSPSSTSRSHAGGSPARSGRGRDGVRVRGGRRWRELQRGLGLLLSIGLGLASSCGLDPGAERLAVRPPRPLPGTVLTEEIAPGAVLVELRRGAGQIGRPAADSTGGGATLAGLPPTLRLGGVDVQVVRPIFAAPGASPAADRVGDTSAPPDDPEAGPIYLVQTAAQGDEATRRDVQAIATDPRVRRAEPDRIRRPAAGPPSDPLFGQQWGLGRVRVPEAWDTTTGSSDVIVAVLDTGIALLHETPSGMPLATPLPHPDLKGRLLPGYDFISKPESSGDDDGRDADPTDTGDVFSSRLHGTHVAGILGANTNNGMGIAGVDPSCRILPVRVLGIRGGDGTDSDIADAVTWASGGSVPGVPPLPRPADILNMSFGGRGVSFTLQRAITEALGRGVLIIAAAGNGGADATTYSPGAMDGVITVGAQDLKGRRADYSNYGPRVDLLAPGGGFSAFGDEVDLGGPSDSGDLGVPGDMAGLGDMSIDGILGTYRDDGEPELTLPPFSYAPLIGTSQATPHVAGAASLAKAVFPGLHQQALLALLRQTASPSGQELCMRDLSGGCGAGLLDVAALVRLAAAQPACACPSDWVCPAPGRPCVAPRQVHPSLFDRPVIRGGWCSQAAGASAGSGWLAVLAALLALLGARPRRRGGARTAATASTLRTSHR